MTENSVDIQYSMSYWASVWRDFKKNRSALLGMIFVSSLFLLAFFAPFLAEKRPIIWKDAAGYSSPLLQEFFAPSEAPETLLETGCNYLTLSLVSCGLSFLVLKIVGKTALKKYVFLIVIVLSVIPFITVNRKFDPAPYRELVEEGKGWGIFPVIKYGPFEQGFGIRKAPGWTKQGKELKSKTYHWMGTDRSGRDVLTRMIHGARVSLAVGVISVAISSVLGIIIGAIAGFFGGWIDVLISRIIEIFICFPVFFAILTLIAIMDQRSIINIILVISLFGWTGVARLVRGEVLKQRSLDYVTASIALGASYARVIFRHILPNSLAPVFVSMTFGIAGSILTESSLSFLGFGVDIPTCSWGELLNQAREAPQEFWWLAIFPGIPIFFTVTVYNMVGEGLRDAMDPRLRGSR